MLHWLRNLFSADYRAGVRYGANWIVREAQERSFKGVWSVYTENTCSIATLEQRMVDVEKLEKLIKK